jgi:hypothetical protein
MNIVYTPKLILFCEINTFEILRSKNIEPHPYEKNF